MNWDVITNTNFDWMLVKAGDLYAAYDALGMGTGWYLDPQDAIDALQKKKQRRLNFLRKKANVRPHNGKPFERNMRHRARRRL